MNNRKFETKMNVKRTFKGVCALGLGTVSGACMYLGFPMWQEGGMFTGLGLTLLAASGVTGAGAAILGRQAIKGTAHEDT